MDPDKVTEEASRLGWYMQADADYPATLYIWYDGKNPMPIDKSLDLFRMLQAKSIEVAAYLRFIGTITSPEDEWEVADVEELNKLAASSDMFSLAPDLRYREAAFEGSLCLTLDDLRLLQVVGRTPERIALLEYHRRRGYQFFTVIRGRKAEKTAGKRAFRSRS